MGPFYQLALVGTSNKLTTKVLRVQRRTTTVRERFSTIFRNIFNPIRNVPLNFLGATWFTNNVGQQQMKLTYFQIQTNISQTSQQLSQLKILAPIHLSNLKQLAKQTQYVHLRLIVIAEKTYSSLNLLFLLLIFALSVSCNNSIYLYQKIKQDGEHVG